MRFFHSLRGKLTLTYTLVTVLALLALEVFGGFLLVIVSSGMGSDRGQYFNDVILVLSPQAREYLQPGHEDLPGLQDWLDGVYNWGYASLEPQYLFDSPAAGIVKDDPVYILASDGTVLAQSPADGNSLVGRRYSPPDILGSQQALELAWSDAWLQPEQLALKTHSGAYWMVVPLYQEGRESVLGVLVVTLEPPPPLLWAWGPMLLGGVMITAAILLVGVVPFGTAFGFIISRSLTRRLAALTAAADAWSEGNFRSLPHDPTRDEIGTLGMRLRNMAERIQNLMQTQQALTLVEERNRLARELHDTVKQQTFATLMQVRAARNLLESDPVAAGQHLEDAESLIKNAQKDLSMIIAELRPAALDERGLAGALQSYLETWSQHACIPADVSVQNERGLPLAVEQALYRVTQEALANAARHSRASAVNVRLEYAPEQIQLVIADNGVGFDPQAVPPSGFGLQSMRERLAALGGRLELQSSPGSGTTVTAVVPAPLQSS